MACAGSGGMLLGSSPPYGCSACIGRLAMPGIPPGAIVPSIVPAASPGAVLELCRHRCCVVSLGEWHNTSLEGGGLSAFQFATVHNAAIGPT